MRLFLIGLSLLYVIGVSFARTVNFGTGLIPVTGACEPGEITSINAPSDGVMVDVNRRVRITNNLPLDLGQTKSDSLQEDRILSLFQTGSESAPIRKGNFGGC